MRSSRVLCKGVPAQGELLGFFYRALEEYLGGLDGRHLFRAEGWTMDMPPVALYMWMREPQSGVGQLYEGTSAVIQHEAVAHLDYADGQAAGAGGGELQLGGGRPNGQGAELGRQAETAVHHVTVGGDQGVLDEEPLQLSLSGPGVLSSQVYMQKT